MQTVKPEWAATQAKFTKLALDIRLTSIISELKALQGEVTQSHPGVNNAPLQLSHEASAVPIPLSLRLRTIQRYVEWTVPELLPRAEEAEILVNVARFAARLMLQENEWNASSVASEIDLWLKQLSAMHTVD